jgi:hypothetical protein
MIKILRIKFVDNLFSQLLLIISLYFFNLFFRIKLLIFFDIKIGIIFIIYRGRINMKKICFIFWLAIIFLVLKLMLIKISCVFFIFFFFLNHFILIHILIFFLLLLILYIFFIHFWIIIFKILKISLFWLFIFTLFTNIYLLWPLSCILYFNDILLTSVLIINLCCRVNFMIATIFIFELFNNLFRI